MIGGKYRLLYDLGAGGFGRVWKARDEYLDVDVAIKEVWLPSAQSEAERAQILARATREARNSAKLRDHPNIITVYDVVTHDGRPWIVMQLVVGYSLEQYTRHRGPLPASKVAEVARALLRALDAAHKRGIIHRDVKPANVMLSTDGTTLLADFGIARHERDTVITAEGTFIGSPEYMAPERLRGEADLPSSDLFSLGATLFQAIEGFSPFRRDTVAASMSAVLHDEPLPLKRAKDPLARLIGRALSKEPQERPKTSEFLALLDSNSDTKIDINARRKPQVAR
ncbi:serine/threonine-protein kinase [Streptomyces sp. CBMA123]|uniref:serine/threonine-protein kinase n=1 Tax=Streptomyces sp. CBMA123 TaxID=1896313 RepID=UPI001662193A|nr:serine/threonine-protein kinase [Streptomyces sp. CBMA123]